MREATQTSTESGLSLWATPPTMSWEMLSTAPWGPTGSMEMQSFNRQQPLSWPQLDLQESQHAVQSPPHKNWFWRNVDITNDGPRKPRRMFQNSALAIQHPVSTLRNYRDKRTAKHEEHMIHPMLQTKTTAPWCSASSGQHTRRKTESHPIYILGSYILQHEYARQWVLHSPLLSANLRLLPCTLHLRNTAKA